MTVRELRALLFAVADQDAVVIAMNWEILGGQRSSADIYAVESVDESATSVSLVITSCGEVKL